MKHVIEMQWSKATKGTQVYTNNEPDTPVTTIYIKKAALPEEPPANIKLTLEYEPA